MSIKNGNKIEAPAGAWEVSKVLGLNSRDVATLCTYSRINPWAKYKPENHPKIGILTDEERAEAQYGITKIPLFGNQVDMASFVKNGTPAPLTFPDATPETEYWEYELPPYNRHKRLTDFDGYWHQAIRPIEPLEIDTIDVRGMADNDLICFDFPVATEAANLKISDFAFTHLWGKYPNQVTNGTTYFLGVCLTDGTADGTRTVTQNASMNNGMVNLQTINGKKYVRIEVTRAAFMAAAPPMAHLTVFPFVTDDSKTTFGLPGLADHPAVPFNFAAGIVNVITGDRYLIAFGAVDYPRPSMDKWLISFPVTVKNQTDSPLTIDSSNKGTVTLYKNSIATESKVFPFSNPTIAPGDTYSETVQFEVTGGSYYAILQWQVAPGNADNYNVKSPTIEF